MKIYIKYLKIYSLIAFLAIMSGCSKDFLDRTPEDKISSQTFWQSKQDAELAVNGCYAYLDLSVYEAYVDGYADNAYCQYPWESKATAISAGSIDPDMNAGYNYRGIRRFNYVLDNIDKAPVKDADKKKYIAEVKTLRALYYFRLANKFGAVPLLTKYTEDAQEAAVAPTPEADVIKFVISELDAAIPSLPQPAAAKSRISKAAALAIKARVHLYYQQWAQAAQAAKQIMNMGNYKLFTVEPTAKDLADDYSKFITFKDEADKAAFYKGLSSYEKIFWNANENNDEVILSAEYIADSQWDRSSGINTLLYADNAGGGWSSITPTVSLVDAYWNRDGSKFTPPTAEKRAENYNGGEYNDEYLKEFKDRDTRLYASIMFPGSMWAYLGLEKFEWNKGGSNISKTGYNFRKLTDPTTTSSMWAAPQDFPVIRYAEVLLVFAEAQNEASGPSQEVYDALNKIRTRAAMPEIDQAVYNTKDNLRELIRNERRIELACEGFRWDDTRRWDISKDVMKSIHAIDNSMAQERRWAARYKRLPYPQSAVDRNPNLKDAQKAKGY